MGHQRFGAYVLARLPCPTLTTFTVCVAVRLTGICAFGAHWMGFIFIGADWFGHTVVLSGEASRPASVTGPFDRESLNSVEQTFTVVVVSFMIAPSTLSVGKGAALSVAVGS